MVVMHRSGINVELSRPHNASAVDTSKAIIYRLCQHLSGVQPPHLLSSTNNLLMLMTILQEMFEICRLGDYCVIDTLQTKCCVTEYGFCVEFVTCVQCALKSYVRPQCDD